MTSENEMKQFRLISPYIRIQHKFMLCSTFLIVILLNNVFLCESQSRDADNLPQKRLAERAKLMKDFVLASVLHDKPLRLEIIPELENDGLRFLRQERQVKKGSGKKADKLENKLNRQAEVEQDEDEIVQEAAAARQDTLRVPIRNSSELHVDNHNETKDDKSGKKNKDKLANYFKKFMFLEKSFHFHIPILSNTNTSEVESSAHGLPAAQQLAPGKSISTPSKPKRGDDGHHQQLHKIVPRNVPTENKNNAEAPPHKRASDTLTLQSSKQDSLADEPAVKSDLDLLLDQYPKLVPSVNRKRNSKTDIAKQDVWEDESHMHNIINLPAYQGYLNTDGASGVAEASMISVKNVNFSQDVVDSMLGHGDDFQKYQEKITSRAEQLGVDPQDLILALTTGKPVNKITTAILQQLQEEFFKVFGDDDNIQDPQNEPIGKNISTNHFGGQHDPGSSARESRYGNYMKILSRNKRGIKKWFKKLFHHGEESSTSTSEAPRRQAKTKATWRKVDEDHVGRQERRRKRPKHRDQQFEVDEKGDAEVDKLLPKGLRRSTFIRNKLALKSMIKEEEEFEEEFEKSEEKEPQRRNEEKEPQRRKRQVKEDGDPELEKRQITDLAKDELLLIQEMIYNIVDMRCENAPQHLSTMLDNLRMLMEKFMDVSNLRNYVREVEGPEHKLFNQILACSEWLTRSDDEAPNSRGVASGTGSSSVSNMKSLRRTKRVKREEAGALEQKKQEQVVNTSLQKLLKFHFLSYKIAGNICESYLDTKLLYDVTLLLINEFNKLENLPWEEKIRLQELLQMYKIDLAALEEILFKCYVRSHEK